MDFLSRDDASLVSGLLRDGALESLANITDCSVPLLEAVHADAVRSGVVFDAPDRAYVIDEASEPEVTQRAFVVVGRSGDEQTLLVADVRATRNRIRLSDLRLESLELVAAAEFALTAAALRRLVFPPRPAPGPPPEPIVVAPGDRAPLRFEPAVVAVIQRLADDDVAGLQADGLTHPEGDLLLWVREAGLTVAPMPGDAWQYVQGTALDDDGSWWAVDVPIWTVEHGFSDFTLELEIRDGPAGTSVWAADLHVL